MNESTMVIVTVTHRFAASCERVFDAWLDPESMDRWMFGASVRDEEIIHLRADPHVGGRFSFLVRRGENKIDHVGTYLEIDRPRRLVFTWSAQVVGSDEDADETPSRVVIELAPADAGCMLTLTHTMDPKWAEFADRTRAGWTTMLGSLDRALAS